MGIYEFGHNIAPCPVRATDGSPELNPHIKALRPDGLRQRSDIEHGRTDILNNACCPSKEPEYVEEFIIPGFRALDESMKMYWSGMRVPTKDAYRFMRVKVAGGDKSVLIWRDELSDGRARLPVAAVDRTGAEFNPEKFSPPILAAGRRYTSNRMDMVAKIYRPVPYLVDYDLTIWAEHKRDLEYILYQILIRFNPLAEFTMFDEHLQGNVQLRFGGYTDASDKEMSFNEFAYRRYEVKMTAEAWLPLPETVVPTVLGTVGVVRERSGNTLLVQRGSSAPPFEPRVQ